MGVGALILLDTHSLVWLDSASSRLGSEARGLLDEALGKDELAVSAISFWEIGTLELKGRLALSVDLDVWRSELVDAGLREIEVSGDIGLKAAALPAMHADPADRLIVATALREGALLCTADSRILGWSGPLLRHDARR